MKRSFVRLLLPVLILGAAGLACSRGVQRDSQEQPAPPTRDSSGELDGAADQVEALLDELETENSQADPLEDMTVEAVEQTPAPNAAPMETPPPTPPPTPPLDLAPTEPAESLSPESEEMLSTLEALVGELEGLNDDADPLNDLP